MLLILLSLLLLAVMPALAAPAGDQPAGQVKALLPDASRNAQPVAVNDTLQWNDLLRTAAKGRMRVGLTDGSILSVGSNSELKVVQHDAKSQQTSIEVKYGELRNQVAKITQPGGKYEVKTANAIIGVIGTDFYVGYANHRTIVICYAGRVAVTPTTEDKQTNNVTTVLPGQMLVIDANIPPGGHQPVAAPATAVQASLSNTDISAATPPGLNEPSPGPGSSPSGSQPTSPQPTGRTPPGQSPPGLNGPGIGPGGPPYSSPTTPPGPGGGNPPAKSSGLNQPVPGPRVPPYAAPTTPPGSGAPDGCDPGSQALVDFINQERAKQGIPPLQVDPRLTQAAWKHTDTMVRHHVLSHQLEGEPPMDARFSAEKVPPAQEAENIGYAPTVVANHESLMHSPLHRDNIMNPVYNVVGVCAVRSGGQLWVTQDFAHVALQYTESQADAAIQGAINQYAQSQGMAPPERKPQAQLQQMACEMAKNGAVNSQAPAQLPGVDGILVWRTSNPTTLPNHAREWLAKPLRSGYSLGACFAPNAGRPGGIYWAVMVTY